MNILKYRDGFVGQPGLVYCGRPKRKTWSCGQLLIGLGNPFSWKQTKLAKFKVRNLEESLSGYRHWLFKLLSAYKEQCLDRLAPWERDYLEKILELAWAIKRGEVSGLVCWCIDVKNYVPLKTEKKHCHTQFLYAACLWLVEEGLVSEKDLNNSTTPDLANLW